MMMAPGDITWVCFGCGYTIKTKRKKDKCPVCGRKLSKGSKEKK